MAGRRGAGSLAPERLRGPHGGNRPQERSGDGDREMGGMGDRRGDSQRGRGRETHKEVEGQRDRVGGRRGDGQTGGEASAGAGGSGQAAPGLLLVIKTASRTALT